MAFTKVAAVGGVVQFGAHAMEGRRQKLKAEEAKLKAEEAQDKLDRQKEMFMHLDTSNPYLNMQNVAEDLVVNQQQAQFQAQQNAQNQANIMESMAGAAGGSGIAALAQTMANQAATQNQAASASIGQQEQANQAQAAQVEAQIQNAERRGEMISRRQTAEKLDSAMQFTGDDVMNAKREQAVAEMRRQARRQKQGEAITSAFGMGVQGDLPMGQIPFDDVMGGVQGLIN